MLAASMGGVSAQQAPYPISEDEARIDWTLDGALVGVTEEDCAPTWYDVPLAWRGTWSGYSIVSDELLYAGATYQPGCGLAYLWTTWYATPEVAPGEGVWIAIERQAIPTNLRARRAQE